MSDERGSTSGRWLPTDSVVVVSDKVVGALQDGPNDDYQQHGGVAKAPNGDLLVMTTLVNPHRIVLLRSTDQGRTWSSPQVVWQEEISGYYVGFSGMTVLRSGRILAVILGYPLDRLKGGQLRTSIVFTVYSDDHGVVWKKGPRHSRIAPFEWVYPFFEICEVSDGTLILPVSGLRDPATRRGANGLIRSRDGGITWGDASIVMEGDSNLGLGPNEMSILALPSGKLLAMFRMNWMKPTSLNSIMLCRSVSSDRGRTWSTPQLVLGATGYVCLQLLPDGAVMVSGSGALGMRYLVSYDEGRSWAYEQLLESSGDAGSISVVLDDHTVFLVHGSGMGPPHHAAYWHSGLRGRWIRKL